MIHCKTFFHLGVLFFHYLNYTLVLYKKNFVLYTVGKKVSIGLNYWEGGVQMAPSYTFAEEISSRCSSQPFLGRQLRTIPKLSLKSLTKEFYNLLPLEWTLIKRHSHIPRDQSLTTINQSSPHN